MMTPIPMLTPEMLAEMAKTGFRPPSPMSPPGLNMPSGGGAPGFGMGGLGEGLGMLLGHGLDFLTGRPYQGDPMASAAYGSARPAIPADVIAGRGRIGGGI